MFDLHTVPAENWGIKSILFSFNGIDIPSYGFFVLLGLIVGLAYYFYLAKKEKQISEKGIYIVLAALIGGVIGAKLPYIIYFFPEIIKNYPNIYPFLSGRTIIGGLIGGFLGVLLIKYFLKIKGKKGNLFVPAICLGVAIGRIGCFLAGCCYGDSTNLPFGVNFGDNVLRHPIQIYESLFMIVLFIYSTIRLKNKDLRPGRLFSEFIIAYFSFRFFIGFIRAEPVFFLGLDFFQIISLLAVIFFVWKEYLYKGRLIF
jgi:phosphatidylglycerol:prolipoprotein diacylglycerol transferase